MSIKSIVGMYDHIKNMDFSEALTSEEMPTRTIDAFTELEKDAEEAKKVILASISEEELVKFMTMVQKITVTACNMNGSRGILKADQSGDLQAYTHTVVLSVIGALIQDEIL